MISYKIVKTPNYLIAIGNNYASRIFPYVIVEKLTGSNGYDVFQIDDENDIDKRNQFEIMAHLNLGKGITMSDKPLLPQPEPGRTPVKFNHEYTSINESNQQVWVGTYVY